MPLSGQSPEATLALSTKVEEDFVAPLTAVRGALEILRDFEELSNEERIRFVNVALRSCSKLERAISELASTVYAAGQREVVEEIATESVPFADRIKMRPEIDTIELDLSDFEFDSSTTVNAFYDVIEHTVEDTGRDWYFIVNFKNCSVWPEAWVAFAHRGKRIAMNHSLGTIRYSDDAEDDGADLVSSREAALTRIKELKTQ